MSTDVLIRNGLTEAHHEVLSLLSFDGCGGLSLDG